MRHEATTRMLISYFNMRTGCRYRFSDWGEKIDELLNESGTNVGEVKDKIRNFTGNGKIEIRDFLSACKATGTQQEMPKPNPIPSTMTQAQANDSINILSQIVSNMVAQMKSDEISMMVAGTLKEQIDQYIFDTYGKIEKKVTLVSEFGKHELPGVQHSKFETVLKFVANDEPVYLAGPAGSGKNVICKQVAEALGLDFYFSNAVTQEYKLTGFTDANGTFHESQFYKAFTKGGVFMLDEMDASIPEVLIILNAAIANRYFDFPAPIGKVEANPNFRVIAAGNTYGYGADQSYVGRNTLDAASLDRFAMIEIDYDERIEMNVTNGNKDLVRFCHAFRKAAQKNGLSITVSYRAMSRIAKMEAILDKVETLKSCLIKGMEKDDLAMMQDSLKGYGEYSEAVQKVLSMMG